MPFGTLQSYADGLLSNSTGIPFFYIAKVSDTYKNIAYNNSVSMTVTQNEGEYCKQKGWDPEEPVCSRVTLTGKVGNLYTGNILCRVPVSQQIVRLQQIVCHCMILELSTELN